MMSCVDFLLFDWETRSLLIKLAFLLVISTIPFSIFSESFPYIIFTAIIEIIAALLNALILYRALKIIFENVYKEAENNSR